MKTFKEWCNETKHISKLTCAEGINYMHLEKKYREMALQDMKMKPDACIDFIKLAFGIVQRNLRQADREAFVYLFDSLDGKPDDAKKKNSEEKTKCNS